MKTASGSSGKANFGRALLLVALAIVVGSTGCQKDDELLPSGSNSISQSGVKTAALDLNSNVTYYTLDKTISIDEALAQLSSRTLPAVDQSGTPNPGVLSNANVWNIIKIDHNSGETNLPDFVLLVRNDGWVVFDGHLNVRVMDRIAFRISDATIPVLHGIFDQYSFYNIVPDFKVYSDMPVVFTTYQPNRMQRPRTIYDDYKSNPYKLIQLRQAVEDVLGIGRYVSVHYPEPVQAPSL